MSFKDHFSKFASVYAKYRPAYPTELFEFLQSLTTEQHLAWDCGTGNGQSAIQLSNYFDRVYATDPSEQQIKHATKKTNIQYKVEKAEHCSLADNSVDLVTVAQAIHWFHFDEFYAEVKRVLKDDGVVAVWTYTLPHVNETIDAVINDFHDETVGEFWQPENKLVSLKYTTIPFPFQMIPTPGFVIRNALSLFDLLGLISSWSATQKFISHYGRNPLLLLEQRLIEFWGSPEDRRDVSWDLVVKAGRNL